MIVSASYRTDIPAVFGDWFRNRFQAGYCLVANPYGGPPSRVALREGVDGYVFWTRNAAPFLAVLAQVARAELPFIVQYTVTGYPRVLERSVPDADRSVAVMHRLAGDYGPRAVVWRYDPIVLSSLTPREWHLGNFARLAGRLKGATDEVVVSFVQPYAKTLRNMKAVAGAGSFDWPDVAEKKAFAGALAGIAVAHGMRLSLCTQPELGDDKAAACVDATRLADLAGHPVVARQKGNRAGCLCWASRDIGAYDTCPQGCAYCYAVTSRSAAEKRVKAHDPLGEYLSPR